MNDQLRALHAQVNARYLNIAETDYRMGRNDGVCIALEVMEAAGFGPGTSTAADEIERLRAALEPLAEMASYYKPAPDDHPVVVRLGQLRATRAALAGSAEEERG